MATYVNFTLIASNGVLNGSTPVTVVAAPSSGTVRTVKSLTIQQSDTVAQVITVNYVVSASSFPIWKGTLNPGDSLVLGEEDIYILDATTKSIAVVMGGAATTTNPSYIVSYADQS